MEAGYARVLARAATIDELLSDAYQPLSGQKGDADLAGRRLAAWCRAAASGDWSLFARRLHRDGLSIPDVLARFATVRRNPSVPAPAWMDDGAWVAAALHLPDEPGPAHAGADVAFEQLLAPAVRDAQTHLWAGVETQLRATLTDSAHADMRDALLTELSGLCAPALYQRFAEARTRGVGYHEFVADMRATGFRHLFEDKPVLLRLMTSVTRQWIDTSREMITRLAADLPSIRLDLLNSDARCRVTGIEGRLSDPHNFGRTVHILSFEDGSRVVYKPKDLSVDAAWAALVDRLNDSAPPVDLRAMRVIARPDYGWTEFIAHTSCADPQDFQLFFRRAGAWLALFHVFVGVDMHQENIVASASHPVPIDLEMVLQASDTRFHLDDKYETDQAFAAAMQTVIDSVVAIGLLPAYGKHASSGIFVIGGVTSNSSPRVTVRWTDVNTDAMQPVKLVSTTATTSNLPYIDGHRGSLRENLDEFMSGFGDYATFLQQQQPRDLLDGFTGLVVRTVIRPTRFYSFLLERMRDHRTMDDGVVWSAQADFAARLADWESDSDPLWPLQHSERTATVDLNVPHFTRFSDGHDVRDAAGTSIHVQVTSGLGRAEARLHGLSDDEIAWQLEVIRQSTDLLRPQPETVPNMGSPATTREPLEQAFTAEADALAATLSTHAVRRGRGAAWIGLDWLGDSEVAQLVVLGPDLYNGGCGIALFLAAHANVTGNTSSEALAREAIAGVRRRLRARNPARMARTVGVGGGLGLGSIVYSLAVIAALVDDTAILADARAAAELITDEVVAADRQLDVLGGCAGAILGLLRLYRQTGSDDVLSLAKKCGRRLLAHDRAGPPGQRTWASPAFGRPLNGLSHGAAGYAYSLTALSHATGDHEFESPATECIIFENSTFEVAHHGWADLRGVAGSAWPCKWCYGAPGIGLARIAMTKRAGIPLASCTTDIGRALVGVEQGWPAATDTLCCGTLGSVEFLWEAGDVLGRHDLRDLATQQLLTVVQNARTTGDYRWSSGTGRFNLGLFRGIAGIGYTLLRAIDQSLPNVLIWE
jgi:type 2 lantibiotic biosynthesis protein LanM